MLRAEQLVWLSTFLHLTVCFRPQRIMGGEETTIDDFPFMVGYERWCWMECGATIVRDDYAMTAAQCVRGNEKGGEITLRVGTSYRESGGYVVTATDLVTHPGRRAHDIALIRSERVFPMGKKVKVVTLGKTYLVAYVPGTIVGWGKQSGYDDSPQQMRKTTMQMVAISECKYAADFDIEANPDIFYCARPAEEGNDACAGDSGGPFLVDGIQHGIVSRGQCTGTLDDRLVFTTIYHYLDWIDTIAGNLTVDGC
ncbi:trypsin delta-like [Schistocerca gregaria]|uniref:trypsin delta-like n=1 Tax=Schistocerca gregaria TaxID=7010 RepID=UPI00211E4C8F|nr:trypsin delta-like [Schistocerca gregaria]